MKAESSSSKLIRSGLVFLALAILVMGVWLVFLWMNLPKDTLKENITLREAQNLVSFPVCVPSYVPAGIDPQPQVIYESDAANVAEETYVRLRYKQLDAGKDILEVYQRYTPDETMKTKYPESVVEGAEAALLNWISYPRLLSESELTVAAERAHIDANVLQTDQTVWWLYEIHDPTEYRSTMAKWIGNHVEYRILSYLPAEEIKKVTMSMLECTSP